MSKSIYKYAGTSNLNKIFASAEHVTLKCSHPKDFNDPYELFLTVDFNEKPHVLAFYAEAIGKLPQVPTTCFSLSPSVVPMWAHYAQNLEGFVIEFDEVKLVEFFPESGFGNVDYRDATDAGLTDMLYRASEIGKPRYVYLLRKWVFSAAYYTKATCWSYEQERRMIVQGSVTRRLDDVILMDVPKECVKALISGPRASVDTISALRDKSAELGCRYYQLKIGRTSSAPYLVDSLGDPFVFNGTDIVPSSQYCASCREPLPNKSKECSWCQIDESHMSEAASRNPYRMYAHYGMLDSYIALMDSVGRGEHKK
jgi:hypothetical protein